MLWSMQPIAFQSIASRYIFLLLLQLFCIVQALLLCFRFLDATTESTVSNVFVQIAILKKVWGGKRHRVFVVIIIIVIVIFFFFFEI